MPVITATVTLVLSAAVYVKDERQSRVIRDAMRHAGIALEKTPQYTGSDPRQFSREIDGETNNAVTRLFQLPTEFKQWLGLTLLHAYGLPAEVETGLQVRRKTMARMDAPKKEGVA